MNIPDIIVYTTKSTERDINNENKIEEKNKKSPRYKKILISSIIIVGIAIIITFAILFAIKHPEELPPPTSPDKKLESEPGYEFRTEVNQLNKIFVNQKYNETTIRNGKAININFERKTIYYIYVISITEPDEEHKLFYSKMYTCAISIFSECVSNKNDNCNPSIILDFLNESNIPPEKTRLLEENFNFKDIPIPLCIFNITDNDAITSITCHESINEGKIKGMVLDLYFYRPPGVKRIEGNNITITIDKQKDGKEVVREISGGKCDDGSIFYSYCSTDSNTTKDSEKNLLLYDEFVITNIINDDENNYLKTKITHLNDITDKNKVSENSKIYKEKMDNLLEKINPYMHYYELVSDQQFKEIYDLAINNVLPQKKNRRLTGDEKNHYKNEDNIFEYNDLGGANIFLLMMDDSSLNTNTFKANSYLIVDEEEKELVSNYQDSSLTDILNKLLILSKAGNKIADELYQGIKYLLEQITKDLQEQISSLNKLLVYNNITEVFDNSQSLDDIEMLPFEIVNESNILYNKVNSVLKELNSQNSRYKFYLLNKNIKEFNIECLRLLFEISDNLNELGNSMNSEGSKLTEIYAYYLQKNSSKYSSTVEEAQNILENYYKDEANLILSKINEMINNFEKFLEEELKEEKNMIIQLATNLENKKFRINNISDDDNDILNSTISNLYDSISLINNITYNIKEIINSELDMKGNYFISQYDIDIYNKSFDASISNSKKIADKLDNDKFVDPIFDEKMSSFNQNITNILIDMNEEKETQYKLKEENLQWSLFKNQQTKNIKKIFDNFAVKVINDVKGENNKYKKQINTTITNFLKDEKENLTLLILDLYVLFSNETLEELSILYDKAFKGSLNYLTDKIKYNEKLAIDYLKEMEQFDKNNSYTIEKLNFFQRDSGHIPPKDGNYKFKYFKDTIKSKSITEFYIKKYSDFINNLNSSEKYIEDQLYIDLINNYKNPIIKLRRALQTIKDNKLIEKYPGFPEIDFNKHKKIIDILYNRLETYLSDENFNSKYIELHKSYKLSEIKNVTKIRNNINDLNSKISKYPKINDNNNDFSVKFQRVKAYMCSNGKWRYRDYTSNYYGKTSNTNNYKSLISISINSDENIDLINFIDKFNEFYSLIDEKIEIYNSKINKLKSDLNLIEEEIMNKNNIFDYMTSFENDLQSIFNNYYGDEIIKSSYTFYNNSLYYNLGEILTKTSNYWINAFEMLETEIKDNLNNFTGSINEFTTAALLYNSIVTQNISRDFYNSIIEYQKNEFNYTISYYYNYLLRITNYTFNYIKNRIMKNEYYYNYIVDKRINVINDLLNEFIENITLNEKESLKIENQLRVLDVTKNDFFNANYLNESNIQYLANNLNSKFINIRKITRTGPNSDQFTVTARFYLEDLDSGEKIKKLYEQIKENSFVVLNKDNFKDIIIYNNWAFNFDEFVNELDVRFYNLNQEINEELSIKIEKYTQVLEEIINAYFSKISIIEKINELYEEGIKKIDNNMLENIMNNINDITDKIIEYIIKEEKRLKTEVASFNGDTTLINNTIKGFKDDILKNLNKTIISIANEFYEKMNDKFYQNYIKKCLNLFYEQLHNPTLSEEFKLLNSSFNLNKMINNIMIETINEYTNITKKQINYRHKVKLDEIYEIINLENINKLINDKIDDEFKNLLLLINKKQINNAGYDPYNFNEQIINGIKDISNVKLNNIENIINSTKGDNYQIDITKNNNWKENYEFEFLFIDDIDIKNTVIGEKIVNDFKNFYTYIKEFEKKSINELLEETIKNNFDNLLNNLIPSFGKLYFDRIVKYNENFKIISLYNNLKYAITESLSYYITISGKITSLPMDLKYKLYTLNNLAEIVENYNKEILDNINDNIDDFDEFICNYIYEEYSDRILNEFLVSDEIDNKDIITMIKLKFHDSSSYIQNSCNNNLIKYLKEPFLESYKKVLKEKTEEMINFAYEQKETLRVQIYKKFTINSDIILDNIDEKLNQTQESINKYKIYANNFEINSDLIEFLNKYVQNNVEPIYSNIKTLIKNAKTNNRNNILEALNKSSEIYLNSLNLSYFNNLSSFIYSNFQNNFLNNITRHINLYNPDHYSEHLEEKKKNLTGNLRILESNETGEIIRNLYIEKMPDKALGKTFKDILDSSNLVKSFITSLNEFNVFHEQIKSYIVQLEDNCKRSEILIEEKKETGIFDEELYDIFNNKLVSLKNSTKDYYNQINESYSKIQNYLISSINNIDESLNHCANVTVTTFLDECNKIKEEFLPKSIENLMDGGVKYIVFNHDMKLENNGQIKYDIKIYNNKKAYFSLDLEFESIKENILEAKIINLSGPKSMQIEIKSGTSNCGESKRTILANFGAANYTMLIHFDTESANINITTITHFEKYEYEIKDFQINTILPEDDFIIINGIIVNQGNLMDEECEDNPVNEEIKIVKEKNNSNYVLL